jgi:hypothetical protein
MVKKAKGLQLNEHFRLHCASENDYHLYYCNGGTWSIQKDGEVIETFQYSQPLELALLLFKRKIDKYMV